MSVFGIFSSKGGVGKSTTAVNLAIASSLQGQKTLIWDLDSQGSTSYFLEYENGLEQKTKKLLEGRAQWHNEVVQTSIPNLSLIPSDISFRKIDILLHDQSNSKGLLQDWIEDLSKKWPIIFLDCPPGLTLLSENIFKAVSHLLVPVPPNDLGQNALAQVREYINDSKKLNLQIIPFYSMVDLRKKSHRDLIQETPSDFFKTFVPYISEIEKMRSFTRFPILNKKSRTYETYSSLWKELEQR